MGKEGQLEWGQRNQKARSDYLIKILISIYDLIMEISLRYLFQIQVKLQHCN